MPKVELFLNQEKYVEVMQRAAANGMSIGQFVKYTFLSVERDVEDVAVLDARVEATAAAAKEKRERMERPRGVV